uniref:Ig-like domain-containing protein n=1 Tax=Astatotilapia calliptera TaxID=8154 RepID=A0AAX7W384_ASTCA
MTRNNCAVFLRVFSFLWMIIPGRADVSDPEASCVFLERCVLPCSFQSGSDVFIHWVQGTAQIRVHSFYHNKDQLGDQDQRFRNRTSLFKDQISVGNASLQVTGVTIQDQGRYKCHISTIKGNQESFVNLKVNALVRQIIIQQVGNRLTCSSEGIYPEPQLTWSTRPPSNITTENTKVQQIEQQLYNISSFLIFPHTDTDLVYICTVSTHRNNRRATWRQLISVKGTYSETTTIPCSNLNSSLTDLVWRFNHSQIILSRTWSDASYTVSEEWKQHVKDVSESGSLTLQDLSSDQEGTYTCEIGDAVETHITNTFLKLDSIKDNRVIPVWLIITIVVVVVLLVVLLIWYYKTKDQKTGKEARNAKRENSEPDREGQGKEMTTAML